MTNDFRDNTFRFFAFSAEICQVYHNLVAGHCAHILSLWNKYIGINFLVIRHHKAEILVFLIKTNDGLVRPLNHPDDCPLRAFSLGSRTRRNLHGIPVHGIFCLFSRNKHILVHAFYSHKAKALCMATECSGQGEGLRLSILAAFGNPNLSFCHQGIQNLL